MGRTARPTAVLLALLCGACAVGNPKPPAPAEPAAAVGSTAGPVAEPGPASLEDLFARIRCEPLPGSPPPGTYQIRTECAGYAVEAFGEPAAYPLRIRLVYTNRTGAAVALPQCHGLIPPNLEKLAGGRWVLGLRPSRLRCLGPPQVVAPGDSLAYTFDVVAHERDARGRPSFEMEEVPGTYRVVWNIYRRWEEDGVVREADLLPLEQRVSNPFRLSVRQMPR